MRRERTPELHKELWQQVGKLQPKKTAQRAQCQYLHRPERYVVAFLNNEYTVDIENQQIYTETTESAEFIEQLCLLAYLINATDLPEAGKLVKAESLPGGDFFFRGVHKLNTEKLERCFGEDPELLYEIAEAFDASRCLFGDASIKLYVLPSLPLTIVIWQSDDEFPCRASVLFDRTAARQLPFDALLAAVNLTIETLVKAALQ